VNVKEEIGLEAIRIVSGDRRKAYGKPEDNFQRIADRWNVNLRNKGIALLYDDDAGEPYHLTAHDVWSFMVDMKLARLAETPNHRDSFVDILGYTLCGAELVIKSQAEIDQSHADEANKWAVKVPAAQAIDDGMRVYVSDPVQKINEDPDWVIPMSKSKVV
jgi:hypothetical protein